MFKKIVSLFSVIFIIAISNEATAATVFENEVNNNFENANMLKLGDKLKGNLATEDTYDFFKFEVKTSGKVHFNLSNISEAFLSLALLDSNGNKMEEAYSPPNSSEDYMPLTIGLTKGTYYLKIMSMKKINADYSLLIKYEEAPTFELEPNNTFETATPMKLNTNYNGTFLSWDDGFDNYKVNLEQDGHLTVNLSQLPGHRLVLTLYNSNGEYIDRRWTNEFVKTKGTFATIATGLRKGTYYIEIEDKSRVSDPYTLSTIFKPSNFYEKEINNTAETASDLEINQTISGNFIHETDPADYYKFTVNTSGNYTVTMKDHFNAQWRMQVLDANQKLINSKETYTLPYFNSPASYTNIPLTLQPGTYYILAEPYFSATSYYDYQLTLTSHANPPFKDVPVGHTYFNEIHLMKSKQIILGHTDGSYKPADTLLRHHAALIIERSGVDLTPVRPAGSFTDVPKSHPSYNSIQKLYQAGIIDGANGKFDPEGTLTREQMAKILVTSFKLEKKEGTSLKFSDIPASRWSYDYVNILASHGITVGYNGKFMPTDKLTREHYAVFLSRVWTTD